MIINNYNRSILNEGRNFGLGYAFCTKLNNDVYVAEHAITACKDYLNDVVYFEKTKEINYTGIHNFVYTPKGIFDNDVYLVVTPVHYNCNGENWNDYLKLSKTLIDNKFNTFLTDIHELEKKYKVENKTQYLGAKTITNHTVSGHLFKLDKFWVSHHVYISMYTLYMRCFMSGDDSFFINEDSYLYNDFKSVLNLKFNVLKSYVKKFYPSYKNLYLRHVHNNGIIHFAKKIENDGNI